MLYLGNNPDREHSLKNCGEEEQYKSTAQEVWQTLLTWNDGSASNKLYYPIKKMFPMQEGLCTLEQE